MSYPTQVITDINKLKIPANPVDLETGIEIGEHLKSVLNTHPNGVGLSANQLGIDARVCVVSVGNDTTILVNPKIVESSGDVMYVEGCLSIANVELKTMRKTQITVVADNVDGKLEFAPHFESGAKMDLGLLESVAVQHEIDHLDGLTIYDRQPKPITRGKKYNRNETVTLMKDKQHKTMKYKKASGLLKDGWVIV